MIRLQTIDPLRKLLQRQESNILGRSLQRHVYWLDKRASGNLPSRAAFVEAEVKHMSARLVVNRGEKKSGVVSFSSHHESDPLTFPR